MLCMWPEMLMTRSWISCTGSWAKECTNAGFKCSDCGMFYTGSMILYAWSRMLCTGSGIFYIAVH